MSYEVLRGTDMSKPTVVMGDGQKEVKPLVSPEFTVSGSVYGIGDVQRNGVRVEDGSVPKEVSTPAQPSRRRWPETGVVFDPWKLEGIGDVNSLEKGSAARYNTDKPDYSLIPLNTLEDEARVWMYGKVKYAEWNWAKGMPWSAPLASMMRHMAAWQAGEDNDLETGLPHLAHAMCNLRMLTLYSKTYKEGDDRPKKWLK